MKNILLYYLLLFNLIVISSASAFEIEIVNLKYRAANDVIPIIKPLLNKNETISGEKRVLFVRASNETLQQIISILPIIDAELRVLRISIMQDTMEMMRRNGYLTSNKKNNNNVIYSTKRSQFNPPQQVILISEGQWASLQTGINIPKLTRSTNDNGTVTESIDYQSIYTRIKIHPAINGKKLNIQVQSNTGSKQDITHSQTVTSSLKGTLGEWIALGGINNVKSNYTFTNLRADQLKQQLFIKIELTKHPD